jgi:hypothetical protein
VVVDAFSWKVLVKWVKRRRHSSCTTCSSSSSSNSVLQCTKGFIILMMLCGLAVACPRSSSSSKLEAGQLQTGKCHPLALLVVVVLVALLLLLAMLIKCLGKCTASILQSKMLLQQQQWRKIVLR